MYRVKIARQSKQASYTPIQTHSKSSFSSAIDVLSQHLGGELPKQIPTQTTQTASETIIVSEIPQQPSQIAYKIASEAVVSKTQTTPTTTIESEPPSNTSTKTVFDTSSILEDNPILDVPLKFAKPKQNPAALDVPMLEASKGETQPDHSTQISFASEDNSMAMEVQNHSLILQHQLSHKSPHLPFN